jgi:GNAT superfamily N-acetyltransferase
LQAELDALDWPAGVYRLDTTGQSVAETIAAIEQRFGRCATEPLDGLTLRTSTPADTDFIVSVTRATMTDYVMRAWGPSEAQLEAAMRGDVVIGQDQIIILSGREIGVLSVERNRDEFFLDKLYILPDYQGWGIGTHLIRAVLDDAFDQGLPVRLGVLKVNPARCLYERLGFVQVGEERTSYIMVAAPPGGEGPVDSDALGRRSPTST